MHPHSIKGIPAFPIKHSDSFGAVFLGLVWGSQYWAVPFACAKLLASASSQARAGAHAIQ